MNGLRAELFETLRALRDKENPMDLDRARVVAEVSGVLVESAKVEVALLKQLRDSVPGSELFDGVTLPEGALPLTRSIAERSEVDVEKKAR